MSDNLKLWQAVETTDPDMTSRVAQRGGFTSIDSYYQIQRATELFGPLGLGWGYHAEYRFEHNLVIALVSLWYVWGGKKSEPFTICTSNQFVTTGKDGKPYIDEDAGKKALTDALTKGLSYLGFSADVFMGKFDDNKYVETLKKKQTAKARNEKFAEVKAALEQSDNPAVTWHEWLPVINGFKGQDQQYFDDLVATAKTRKEALAEIEKQRAAHGDGFVGTPTHDPLTGEVLT